MDRMVEEVIRDCRICASSDRVLKPQTAPMTPTEWPTQAWERLAVDIRGPDYTAGLQGRFALVVVDYYSKWVEVELMQEVKTSQVIDMFQKLFNREGIPKHIVSDNGSQFTSREFARFLEERGIRHQKTPLYHAQANGAVERFNRTLGGFMETASRMGGDVARRIAQMVASYNATPQATTGKSPAELLHGRPMRTGLNVVGAPDE